MFRMTISICALAATAAFAQPAGPGKAALQQRFAQIKQSIAQNQAQLRQYAWTETTEMSLKGEVKKRTQNDCRYGPDGKVVKTPIGAAPPAAAPRGLRGKVVANKKADINDYMDRVGSLVSRYVPPDPQALQTAFQSGKVALEPGAGALVISGYYKPGDKVTVIFDTAAKKIRSFSVATYLDDPKEVVTLNASFSTLPDGTNYVSQSVLVATAKEIQITTTNFGHHKVGS